MFANTLRAGLALALIAGTALAAGSAPAMAGGKHFKKHGHHFKGHHYKGHYYKGHHYYGHGYYPAHCFTKKVKVHGYYGWHWKKVRVCA